ncbi:hypothetical protein [Vibrio parahaemolyticus]|uniref:hypothetical protein n=1 Tax=Vibrio parahaemolyticus TaxID=670 RepID=UPI0005F17BC8|nr:hypothetical protein [Vibrio parahaemolyticus]KJR15253.1 hypothetical protein UF28_16450 [Vibrio parahaemolyticus]
MNYTQIVITSIVAAVVSFALFLALPTKTVQITYVEPLVISSEGLALLDHLHKNADTQLEKMSKLIENTK